MYDFPQVPAQGRVGVALDTNSSWHFLHMWVLTPPCSYLSRVARLNRSPHGPAQVPALFLVGVVEVEVGVVEVEVGEDWGFVGVTAAIMFPILVFWEKLVALAEFPWVESIFVRLKVFERQFGLGESGWGWWGISGR